jgi:hypothetical protein
LAWERLLPRDVIDQKIMTKFTKQQKRDAASITAKKDSDIDFSDAPQVVDWSAAEIGKFHRPAKRPAVARLAVATPRKRSRKV